MPKGNKSGDTRDFNNIEKRAVINYFFLQGKAPNTAYTPRILENGQNTNNIIMVEKLC
jgi:hypothetical protein